MTAGLAERLLGGERRAVARAISAVENETVEAGPILKRISAHLGRARVLGITGPPGAGKSTLTGALIGEYLRQGERVAVVAVDPSSPFSGGAILGDPSAWEPKADLPGADRLESELLAMSGLRAHSGWTPRVVRTVATSGEGVASLALAIAAREAAGSARAGRRERIRRLLACGAAEWLRGRIESLPLAELEQLCEAFGQGDLEPSEAWRRAAAVVIAKGEE